MSDLDKTQAADASVEIANIKARQQSAESEIGSLNADLKILTNEVQQIINLVRPMEGTLTSLITRQEATDATMNTLSKDLRSFMSETTQKVSTIGRPTNQTIISWVGIVLTTVLMTLSIAGSILGMALAPIYGQTNRNTEYITHLTNARESDHSAMTAHIMSDGHDTALERLSNTIQENEELKERLVRLEDEVLGSERWRRSDQLNYEKAIETRMNRLEQMLFQTNQREGAQSE